MENEQKPLHGILLIDKPLGITSFDVIRRLQIRFRELGYRKVKMGHAGTLDPAASGLLLVAVGSATRQLEGFIGQDKAYQATVRLGQATDTLDTEGEIVRRADASAVSDEQIRSALGLLSGCHEYPVPLYSAVKVEGKALYAYARAGRMPPRIPSKTMCVRSATCLDIVHSEDTVDVSVEWEVSKGTYIRTLAEQLGSRLDLPAMLVSLRRISIANYFVNQAVRVEDVVEADVRPL